MSRKSRLKVKKNFKAFWASSFLTIVMLVGFAVLQINGYIHDNSYLADCAKQIKTLTSQNDALEANLSSANSMDKFDQYYTDQSQNFEKIGAESVKYIKVAGGQLAKR